MKLKELYVPVTLSTGEKGTLEGASVAADGCKRYFFRPNGANKTTGERLEPFEVLERDVDGPTAEYPDFSPNVFDTDTETLDGALKGRVTKILYYMGGCIHAVLQPAGTKPDGERRKWDNLDIRSLKGDAIKPLTSEEKAAMPVSPISNWGG